ncbi:TetR family transcriptional regulator [Chromobacterium sp. IIBBL 290-4]|uniref:TetR family transcriptional regulator n=1 Tax=Chromobacterium sp. IIBBL 290-4 TaxID=2953890 RepID=UPI0020B689B9|nr:TetR family transcriptional regulator [Chromobacterium sp. IIBBL 290-4]UTH73622.1 TetR family transcriptional regulator [Chromobacterium sp. IIBBL 290-4]
MMARKTKEDSQKTRDAILDGAEQVFLAKGIANATMADIADAAQVSRGAVYGHYENKLQVCQAMIDRAFALDALRFPPPGASACETLLQAALYYLAQFLEPGSPQRVYQILYLKCEQTEENRGVLRRREQADRMTVHYARRQLRRAVLQQELPAGLDIGLTADYLVSLFIGLYELLEQNPQALPRCERILRGALSGLPHAAGFLLHVPPEAP